jgi:hypothetical protein
VTSSLSKLSDVGPSSEIELSSYMYTMRPSPSWPASEAASDAMPSMRSPSEQITYVRWSWTSEP